MHFDCLKKFEDLIFVDDPQYKYYIISLTEL